MSATRRMYMHTLDGKPAAWSPRDGQICFADQLPNWQDKPFAAKLRASVRQIRRDHERTIANRTKWKMDCAESRYGWVVVEIPR